MTRSITKTLALLTVALTTTATFSAARAAGTIDQQSLTFNTAALISDDVPIGQSFTAGLTGTFSEFDLLSDNDDGQGTATVNIYSGSGYGGTLLGSTSIPTVSTDSGNIIPFDISSLNIQITAGSTYTFAITAFTGNQAVLLSSSNPYAGGNQFNNPSSYGSTPTWDLAFKTFVVTTPTPEPASLAILALGGVILTTRRRRKA